MKNQKSAFLSLLTQGHNLIVIKRHVPYLEPMMPHYVKNRRDTASIIACWKRWRPATITLVANNWLRFAATIHHTLNFVKRDGCRFEKRIEQ